MFIFTVIWSQQWQILIWQSSTEVGNQTPQNLDWMHFVKNFVLMEKVFIRKTFNGMWTSSLVRSMDNLSSKPKISFQVISSPDMIRTLSKPRSKSNLINIHMKFILLVIIGALLWNNNQARQFTSDSLQSMSDFIEPNQQREIKLSFWFVITLTSLHSDNHDTN